MNLLIINIHSVRNAGDAALLEMAVRTSTAAYPDANVCLAMNDPVLGPLQGRLGGASTITSIAALCRQDEGGRGHWRAGRLIQAVLLGAVFALVYRAFDRTIQMPPPWRRLFAAYASADLVVSCPGNILADTGRFGLPLLVSAWSIALCLLMGKPLYVLPQSIGPFRHWWSSLVLKALYSRAQVVMVREPLSHRLAIQAGLDSARLLLIPDLAFAYAPTPPPEDSPLLGWLLHAPGPVVGVTVINRPLTMSRSSAWDEYESAVAGALSAFQRANGGSVVFFPQVTGPSSDEDDRVASHRIASQMHQSSHVYVATDVPRPSELKWLYGLTEVFLATRMHSAIFATSMYVPTLMIEYMHKTRGLAELLGLEKWVMNISGLQEHSLAELLLDLWENRSSVKQQLHDVLPQVIQAAEAAPKHLAGR